MFKILFSNDHFVAIEKPARFLTHAPQDKLAYYNRKYDAQFLLKRQLGKDVFPVHRLDKDTSGILVFSFNSIFTKKLNEKFTHSLVEKKYIAVLRGWIEDEITIDAELESDEKIGSFLPAKTFIKCLSKIELPMENKRFSTSRYSFVEVRPFTGKFHQIRRHCKAIDHPIVGDKLYGDNIHNKIFRENLKIPGLLLRSQQVSFQLDDVHYKISGKFKHQWHQVFNLFGICPFISTFSIQ